MNGAAALYGKSLYDLAKEERNTKEILEEMEVLRSIFQENISHAMFCAFLPRFMAYVFHCNSSTNSVF